MKKTLTLVSLLLVVLALTGFAGCGGSDSSSTPLIPDVISFSTNVQPIFNLYCTTCHWSGGEASFLPLVSGQSYLNLVNQSATQSAGVLVTPTDSAQSVLYLRVSGTSLGLQMPKNRLPLSVIDQEIIRLWIDQGALNN